MEWASIHHDAQNTGNYQFLYLYKQSNRHEAMVGSVAAERQKQAWLLLPLFSVLGWRRRTIKRCEPSHFSTISLIYRYVDFGSFGSCFLSVLLKGIF